MGADTTLRTGAIMTPGEIESAVAAGMPQSVADLKRLVAIPSVALALRMERPAAVSAASNSRVASALSAGVGAARAVL